MVLARLMLLGGAMAEEQAIFEPVELEKGVAVEVDLDGDGAAESVTWTTVMLNEYDEESVVTVSNASGEVEWRSGMLYGLLCGALWDLSAAIPDGIYALYFTIFACLAGLLTHYILRNTLISALVLNIFGTLGVCLINFIFNCLAKDAADIWHTVKFFYAPSFILTVAVIPFIYFPIRLLERKIRTKTII